jgi:hypothetical protein
MAAERLHGDDTTVPVLAKGKTDTGRCWVYVRDDRPFGGHGPPAAMFYYSRDRKGEHPQRHLASRSMIGYRPDIGEPDVWRQIGENPAASRRRPARSMCCTR